MPELPEVETIRRDLIKRIKGKRIVHIEVKLPKQVFVESKKGEVKKFKKILQGSIIRDIYRRAKILKLELDKDYTLYIHLKLTGQLIYRNSPGVIDSQGGHPWPPPDAQVPNAWTHITFEFRDGSRLYFNDVRQFGYMKLVGYAIPDSDEFGPEPLEKKFTHSKFKEALSKRPMRKIKQLLMDQAIIAGIGNIYSDEILFYARILPTRISSKLKQEEIRRIYQGIKVILKKAVKARGTSFNMYRDASGRKGGFEKYLKVYGRKGKKCKRCETIIQRIIVGGRSSHFCEKCQE